LMALAVWRTGYNNMVVAVAGRWWASGWCCQGQHHGSNGSLNKWHKRLVVVVVRQWRCWQSGSSAVGEPSQSLGAQEVPFAKRVTRTDCLARMSPCRSRPLKAAHFVLAIVPNALRPASRPQNLYLPVYPLAVCLMKTS